MSIFRFRLSNMYLKQEFLGAIKRLFFKKNWAKFLTSFFEIRSHKPLEVFFFFFLVRRGSKIRTGWIKY